MNNLAINELKKEKNAIILGHYYSEIQDIARGDSLALAQLSAKTEADIIVMCGVHFMGEKRRLCFVKKVLVPDMEGLFAGGQLSGGSVGAVCQSIRGTPLFRTRERQLL